MKNFTFYLNEKTDGKYIETIKYVFKNKFGLEISSNQVIHLALQCFIENETIKGEKK